MIAIAGAPPDAAPIAWIPVGSAALATAVATWGLARFAERRGWVDDGSDAPTRKLQVRPVAPVGGTAILCGWSIGALVAASLGTESWFSWADFRELDSAWFGLSRRAWFVLALLAALAVGLCDDLKSNGLTPVQKLAGQSVAAACLSIAAAGGGADVEWVELGLWFAGGVLAQNAMNTFDNADGAATSVALLGFSSAAPMLAAALCGFLPFNIWLRRRSRSGTERGSVPIAYLGDSGSHVLGLLLLMNPVTRLALFLPLLDLARVAFVRLRLGIPPWTGDRRHLAHRLLNRGCSPTTTVAVMCAIALPVLAAGLLAASRAGGGLYLGAGAAGSAFLFAAVLRACPANE